ncbi:MAG: ROK family protein [Candidatus Loosdrechtia sp.]|uniref:ROK family protein n=1 Tax=Candidatus Loosdrechtia sp. TaxID=3101272 RepID=UPI003A745FB5|nr:MAG: ROK family protein [Candidatus Jettenia sp. AMX2]
MSSYAVGVDLGGTNLKAGIVDSSGRIHNRLSVKTDQYAPPETISEQIFKLIDDVIITSGLRKSDILGIGLGSPGLIDRKGETILVSPNLPQWHNIPIRSIIAKRFVVPCILENDANAAAWGEKWAGAGKFASSMVMITLGTGIGGGIIIENRIWRGFNNVAGEIGHMIVHINGQKCNCGNYGCIEAYASAPSMVRRFKDLIRNGVSSSLKNHENITAKMISEAARQGDKTSLDIIKETGQYLGIALTNIIHILNPEVIVLAGGMIGSGELLMVPLREAVKQNAFAASYKDTKIAFSELGIDAGIIGAAGCLLKELETFV